MLKLKKETSIAVILLHAGCNMSCTFCATSAKLSPMTLENACGLFFFLKRNSITNIVLGGGEPFAWKHNILALARKAKETGFFVQVGTNGIALPENFADIDFIDRYVLPLDSAEEKNHNDLRRYSACHHSIILNRLERLKNAGKSVTVSTVVTQKNLKYLELLGAFLSRYRKNGGKIHAWHLYRFIPMGRGGRKNAADLHIEEAVFDKACHELKKTAPGFAVYKRKDMYASKTVDFFWYEKDELKIGSLAFSDSHKGVLEQDQLIAKPLVKGFRQVDMDLVAVTS